MYCPQCGAQNDNSALFCKSCGKKLEGVAAKTALPKVRTDRSKKIINEISSIKLADDPVLNAVKKLVLSPLNFVATIAFSLMIILTISNAETLFTNLLGYLPQFSDIIGSYELYELQRTLYVLSGFLRLLVAVIMLPQIVIGIGMWITIFTSFRKGNEFSLSGMKAIKVINVISFVFSIIGLVVSIGAFIWVIKSIYDLQQSEYFYGSSAVFVLPIIIMLSIGIIGFGVYYRKQIINVIDCFISTVNGRTPYIPGKFVAVMCFISCCGYVFSGIIYPTVIAWCSAIAFLCFGLFIIKTGNVLKPLIPKSRLLNEIENSDAVEDKHLTEA